MRPITFIVMFCFPFTAFSQSCEEAKEKFFNPAISRITYQNTPSLHNNYDQKFIHINIEANDSNTFIINTVHYLLKSRETIHQLYFEFSPTFTIDSIKVNNQFSTYYYSNDTLLVFPPTPVQSNELFTVSISYHGFSSTGGTYRGLTNTYSNEYQQHITWTLSESFHLKDWLPCKQELTDRLDSAWIFITVDSTCKAGSEGILTAITPLGNGKVRYEWKERHPIVYYLLSIAVGKYVEYTFKTYIPGMADSLLVMNYLYQNPQCLIDNKTDIDRTADFLRIYSNRFGLYPFHDEKYGHSQVPLGGGMEHQTMTSLGYFVHWLVAHELSHQWFGNNITCATWQDIWINEGFASYAEYIALQDYFGQTIADITIRNFQQRARMEPEGSVYVPFEEATNEARIFSSNLSYKKGACIIHMLRYLCDNDSIFFNGLKQLQIQFKDSVLTGEDVKHVYENLTGLDLTPFFNQFYYGKGFPIYSYNLYQDSLSNNQWSDVTIKVMHRGSSTSNNLFTIPIPVKIVYSDNSDTLVKLPIQQNVQFFTIPSNRKKIASCIIDPNDWLLDSLEGIHISVNKMDFDATDFWIYPNPANSFITIYSAKPFSPCTIQLYNSTSLLIESHQISTFPYTIQFQTLYPKGVYFLVITNDMVRKVEKIVIQ